MAAMWSWATYIAGAFLLGCYAVVCLLLILAGSPTQCGDGVSGSSVVVVALCAASALCFSSMASRPRNALALGVPIVCLLLLTALWLPVLANVSFLGARHCGAGFIFRDGHDLAPLARAEPAVHVAVCLASAIALFRMRTSAPSAKRQ